MSAHRRSVLRALVLAALALALPACGILPKQQAMEILSPQIHVTPDPAWPQVQWQLALARPTTNDLLDSPRLAVIHTPGRIQVYQGVSWDDTVPDIAQTAALEAFQDSGRIVAVGRHSSGLNSDFFLQFDLRDDEAVYNTPEGPPEIVIVINARLVDSAHSRAIADRTFRATATASSTDVHAVARAFDSAMSSLMHDVVGWTLVNGEQARMSDAQKH